MADLTALELARELASLAADNGKIAAKYADLAAECVRNDEERKGEIDGLRAEIAKLGARLAESIEKLRHDSHSDAKTTAAVEAQELLNRRELAKLQDEERDRKTDARARRMEVWKILATILISALAVEAFRVVVTEAAHPRVEQAAPPR